MFFKLCERTERQIQTDTDRCTDGQTNYNTLQPYWGEVKTKAMSVCRA